ncbi:hypothetical protein [Streptomyces sp. NPDC102264]|uniref:hypothetical protein n=1 Tax=Streptomyces sp. NPDC102264 TaxID=3366149 RepID=UPI003826AD05
MADRVGEPMAGLLHGQSGISAADAADVDGIGHGAGHPKRVSSVAALLAEVAPASPPAAPPWPGFSAPASPQG